VIDWLNKTHTGDVRAVLTRMIAAGVQVNTIITSPPYWGLRSYLPAGHPDKALEIGSEPTLREFLDTIRRPDRPERGRGASHEGGLASSAEAADRGQRQRLR
jgi:DNA modification methylase